MQHVALAVDDGRGLSVTQSFDLSVVADTEAPTVTLVVTESPGKIGDTVSFVVMASDNVGVTSLGLTVGGTVLPLSATGQATLKLDHAGSLDLVATATDAAGNTGKFTDTLLVIDPTVTGAPTVTVTSLPPDTTVTAPTDIKGTISGPGLLSYSVDVYTQDGNLASHVAGGSSVPASGVLGTLDPTLLANGAYDLRVTATNIGGHIATIDQPVNVAGDFKLGDFTLSFNDLALPVSGIPVSVIRTYDSLQSARSEDFGYGWRLEYGNTDLQTTVPPTSFEDDGLFNPFSDGTKVFVTVPGGRRESFTFAPTVAPGLKGSFLGILEPAFQSDPGVTDTLSVDQNDLRRFDDGTYGDYFGDLPYNPVDPTFGGTFYLTTKQGIVYTIDGQTGNMLSVADKNGNQLNFTDAGIFSKAGPAITFARDPSGRIVTATDPTGKTVNYTYNAAGDLASVTDPAGNTTTFDYSPDRPHYLLKVTDPQGRVGARAEYDASGRLVGVVGATGNEVKLSFDPSTSTQTTSDARGNVTVLQLDDRGNVLQEVDPLGGVTKKTYDANNHVLSETDPLGNTTTFTYDDAGDMLTSTDPLGRVTRYTYDTSGHRLTTTDPLGETTTDVYDAQGNILKITDPTGTVAQTNTYDAQGNLTTSTDALGLTTKYAYDSSGNMTSVTTPAGNVVTMAYDGSGHMTSQVAKQTRADGTVVAVTLRQTVDAMGKAQSVIDPNGNTIGFTYDAQGNVTSTTDRLGHVTKYVYDDSGNRIKTINPDGTTITSQYDADNHLISTTDAAGNTTTYGYDTLGRLVLTTYPDGSKTSVAYDADSRPLITTDADGNTTTKVYDAAGQLVQLKDAVGGVTTYAYDAAGRKIAQTDPLGRVTKYVYDADGRLIKTVEPDGSTTSTTYDTDGRAITQTDENGHTTSYTYDGLGRVVTVTDPLGGKVSYAYDELGDVVSQTDAAGRATKAAYDTEQHVTGLTLALGQSSSSTYDADGNLLTSTDGNGQVTHYQYDAMNHLVRESYADGTEVDLTYTKTGQRATATDARGVTTYAYDVRDRLIKVVGPDGAEVDYTYDAAGNETSMKTPAGTTTYTYDALNRLATVTDPAGGVTRYAYDADGELMSTAFPNGTSEARTYDSRGRLLTQALSGPSATISSETYTYDPAGNQTSVRELSGRVVKYTYDALNRVTEESITDPTAVDRVIDYTYDATGNILTKNDSVAGLTTDTYDANDRLTQETTPAGTTSFTYDGAGNMLSRVTDAVDQVLYHWNAKGQFAGADITTPAGTSHVTYGYDADGNRVSETVDGTETRLALDVNAPFTQVAAVYKPDGTVLTSYVYGDGPISQTQGGQVHYYVTDALGSVRALTDATGAVTDRFTYDAYGSLLRHTGTTTSSVLFAGQWYDPVTGLVNLRARQYDPALGRFISVDPASPNRSDTQSLDRYTYTRGNPVDRIDPSGRQDLGDVAAAIAITGILASIGGYAGITGGVLFYRRPEDFLVAPDAGLVGFTASVSPSAIIGKTAFGATPIGFALEIGLFLVSGVGGVDILVPSTLDRAWFYVYYGVSFGFSGFDLSALSFSGYVGLVYQVKVPGDYAGPFLATGGTLGRYAGVVPKGATVFTGFGREESYGFNVPVTPSSSTFSFSAALTNYIYVGEVTTQDIIDAITLKGLQDYLGRLEYELRQGAIDSANDGF
jgi:RHS repeat-associated protein